MTHLLSLGAINKLTGEYVYPKIANKKDEYICPECNKDLILCQGEIRVHHFRHKVDSIEPCNHYSNPTETQIHKDAKILLKNLFERKIPISFIRKCCCCKNNEEFEIPEITETSVIQLEYRFEYNGVKIADVAYIDNNEILCIFEICNTHKTCSENRPEPWFETNAETLIKIANDNSLTSLQIPCVRCEKCEDCVKPTQIKTITLDYCFQNPHIIRLRNRNRICYYNHCNKTNINKIIVPYEYIGNITEYPLLVNSYITEYIKKYETTINKTLFYTDYYCFYNNALKNIYKYRIVSDFLSKQWNKNIVDIKKINVLLKKDNLINPVVMFKKIVMMFETTICKKCNNTYYCICDLNKREIDLLNQNICLICKFEPNIYNCFNKNISMCGYCYKHLIE